MRYFVTGGHGFVGQAAVRALAARHQPMHLALRRPWGRPLPAHTREVAWALNAQANVSAALRGCDAVLHLAARVHVMQDDSASPLAAFRAANTAGALQLARQAAASGVQRFVFVSTIKVHGEASAPGQAFTADISPQPVDHYATSKAEAEQGLREVAETTGMQVVIIRPPLVYGPGVKANFAALMRAVARGWPLPLGSIHNRRSLVGIDNLVDLLLLCLEHPAAANQTFLVSDGEDLSTPDLLRRMGRAMGKPARLWPLPVPLLEASAALLGRRAAAERLCGNLQVDITKTRTLLGWQPPVSVDEGLRRAAQGMAP
ncbi:NAD-dependent dehydratase [Pseudorhodoferax sp. Leaf267]|nr:NAD-dependent dehydratase [Pseudorhodoferax sp. Leaf267]